MLCVRWHQLIPVLDVGTRPTISETTINTSTSTPSATPRKLNNACYVQNNAKLGDQRWGSMLVLLTCCWRALSSNTFCWMQSVKSWVQCLTMTSSSWAWPPTNLKTWRLQHFSCFFSTQSTQIIKTLHHANTTAASSQLCYQSSEVATHVVNTQKCGWHYQRLMCLMVTLIDIQYLVCWKLSVISWSCLSRMSVTGWASVVSKFCQATSSISWSQLQWLAVQGTSVCGGYSAPMWWKQEWHCVMRFAVCSAAIPGRHITDMECFSRLGW